MVVMIGTAQPTVKIFDNKEETVTPFFGLDRDGEFAQMGIGCVGETGGASMWGLLAPHLLITSWRAMQILTHLTFIDNRTYSRCWYAANGHQSRDGAKAINELEEQFANREVLEELVAAVPDAKELEGMLSFVREHKIDVSVFELRELVDAGLIPEHPIILELETKQQKISDRYEARERFIARPMEEQDSLGSFFALLGIDNLLDGVPYGGYGMDWGHIKLGDLDSMIKQTSTGDYASSFALRRTTLAPTTSGTPLGRGGSMMFTTKFGNIETPYYIDYTGTKYTFDSAKYRHNQILVSVHVDEKAREMTVAELREMVMVKKFKKLWLRRR